MRQILCVLLLLGTASGQTSVQSNDDVAIRTSTNEVLVDVTIRDSKNRLIRGLQRSEITVLEDGIPQTITEFREASGGTLESTAGGTSPAANSSREAKSVVKVDRQLRPVVIIFERLGPEARRLAKQAARDFIKADLGANTFYMVAFNERRLFVVQPFSNDKDKLDAAIDKATNEIPMDFVNDGQSLDRMIANSGGGAGASDRASAAGAAGGAGGPPSVDGGGMADEQALRFAENMQQLSDSVSRDVQGRSTVFGLWGVVQQLAQIPGKKTILYFSEGIVIPNGVTQQFKAMMSAANRANVTIHTIDARGLNVSSDQTAATARLNKATGLTSRMTRSTETLGTVDFRAMDMANDSIRDNRQNNLAELAETTGGRLIANTNDMRPQLRNIGEEVSSYYELVYRSSNPALDGRFRKIEVKVNRKDAEVQAREGYFALPLLDGQVVFPYEVPLLQALGQNPLPRQIDFRANLLHFQPGNPGQGELVFELPLDNVAFVRDDKEKAYRVRVSVMALVKDSEGHVVAKLSRDVSFSQPISKVDGLVKGKFIVTKTTRLQPGRYVVEAAVIDRGSEKLSTRRLSVVVPEPTAAPILSSLALVRRAEPSPEYPDVEDAFQTEKGKIIPTLFDNLPAGKDSVIGVYFKLYPQKDAEAPRLVLDLLQDEKLLARLTPPLDVPGKRGDIPYLAKIPAGSLTKGQYEVRATLLQGNVAAQKSIIVNIE